MKRDYKICSSFKSPDGQWGQDSDDPSSVTCCKGLTWWDKAPSLLKWMNILILTIYKIITLISYVVPGLRLVRRTSRLSGFALTCVYAACIHGQTSLYFTT